ncbi:MAG: hypothetical protein M8350_05210 [Methanosarcinaceae archaeon]|nr:hypothetical protein [Methanosarcinaceae archaeon]
MPTKSRSRKKAKHTCPPKITDSTPAEVYQVNLIADLTEEEYLEFAGMCGV